MPPENNLTLNNVHPNYKRIVTSIGIVFLIIVIVSLGYYYFSHRRAMIAEENAIRLELQAEQAEQTAKYFATFENKVKPATDADKKEIEAMIQAGAAADKNGDITTLTTIQQQESDLIFQERKANQ